MDDTLKIFESNSVLIVHCWLLVSYEHFYFVHGEKLKCRARKKHRTYAIGLNKHRV